MQAPDIKKLAGFPVQLHRHVRAAVEVGIDPAPVAHRERRLGLSVQFDLEAYPVARIRQIGARTNYAFFRSHHINSSILSRKARILAIRGTSGRQGVQETSQRLGQWGAKLHRVPRKRMLELQLERVQEHALQALLRQRAVELEVAVLVITRDRKSEVAEMDADLMSAAGQQLRRQQRVIADFPFLPENRLRLPALAVDAYAPLSGPGEEVFQRKADMLLVVAPASLHQGQVFLPHPTFAQRGVQRGQRRAFLGEDQQSRGLAIEPVRKLQKPELRPRSPHL